MQDMEIKGKRYFFNSGTSTKEQSASVDLG